MNKNDFNEFGGMTFLHEPFFQNIFKFKRMNELFNKIRN